MFVSNVGASSLLLISDFSSVLEAAGVSTMGWAGIGVGGGLASDTENRSFVSFFCDTASNLALHSTTAAELAQTGAKDETEDEDELFC